MALTKPTIPTLLAQGLQYAVVNTIATNLKAALDAAIDVLNGGTDAATASKIVVRDANKVASLFTKPPHVTDAAAPNDTLYFSTDSGKIAYKDSGGTSHDLY